MGSIYFKRIDLITSLSEIVGYKSGIALSKDDLLERLPEYNDYFDGDDEEFIRIRSEEYGEMYVSVLYKLGCIPSPESIIIPSDLLKKYSGNITHQELLIEIFNVFFEEHSLMYKIEMDTSNEFSFDYFLKIVEKKYGIGLPIQIAEEIFEFFQYSSFINPWTNLRFVDWKDTKELSQLFNDESLSTYYGNFFDQRFIDYLYKNFDDIDKINWRKFEGLTAEFFIREGFRVEIGSGRNDGGIDVRVWSDTPESNNPQLILIQCKRQKHKIDKIIVKALWADTVSENAKSGLIVTSSSLSPGAEKVCSARAYSINVADRRTLFQWLSKMRSPYSGIFFGEQNSIE